MMAGCAYGQLTVGTNDIWRLKKGDIVVTNVTLTGVVFTNSAELAQKVDTNETRAVKLNTLTVTNGIRAADGSWSIDPNNRELRDADGLTMIDWTGVLRDGYRQSLDFVNRGLLDSTEKSSVNWQDRLLNYSNYETALDWGTPGLFKVGGSLTVNGTNVMTEIAGKVPASRTITVNGTTGTLTSNLSFTVTAGITGATVTNIVNAFTFTNQTWAAAGTNATYQMAWDVTNMTFKVLEILP
jgi:hypothetical protein